MNKKSKLIFIIFLSVILISTTGFTKIESKPRILYRVYLKGESLGLIKSKKKLEEYINKEQDSIKKKYNVNNVYPPEDLSIEKEITYSNDIKSINKIYEEIKDISPFTIKGYLIKIRGLDTVDSTTGKKIKGKVQTIYVIDKSIFTNSMQNTAKSFVTDGDYTNYSNNTQKEIKDTGKIIKKVIFQ